MARDATQHLLAFVAVAREGSFTRAAGKLGVTPSALSHAVRNLESAMGVRLLERTTRRVSSTEVGDRLLQAVASNLDEIEAKIATISALRHEPMGTVRITATDFVADTLLWPRISPVLHRYPRIKVDIITSYQMTNVVSDRFDFGVRSGSQVDKDMVARRISADYRRVIVGSPAYFERKAAPATPQDLMSHSCIAMRLASSGAIYSWGLKKGKKSRQVRVGGQLTFNNTYQILDAALSGCGLAFTPEPLVQAHVSSGRLKIVLEDWSPASPGFFLYYPRRGQHSRAAALILEALVGQAEPG